MRTQFLSLALVIVMLCPFASAQSSLPNLVSLAMFTDIPAGAVRGIWTRAGSPYHITGEITVPNDSSLLIEPGVEVVFMGHHKLKVQGRLLAVGTQQDTIRFRSADIQAGWHGMRFESTPNTNDTSRIIYCSFKYGKGNTGSGFDRCGGAMLISRFDKVLVSNCLFDSNMQIWEGWNDILPQAGPAIYIYHASPTITQSTFSHHTGSLGSAITCLGCPKTIISENIFAENYGMGGPVIAREIGSPIITGNLIRDNVATYAAGGIAVEAGATPRIENNIIVHNRAPDGGGICWPKGLLLNNTIAYNTAYNRGGGIFCDEGASPILINNILFGNTAAYGSQAYLADGQSDPVFLYCNVQGGTAGFAGAGAGANYTGRYEDNMNTDPWFLNAESSDYRLSDSSECIGAGIDSIEVSGVWYHAPLSGFGGKTRPMPAGSRPDMGAFESPLGSAIAGPAYAHDVRLSRHSRDTVRITARVVNPLAHAVSVAAILTAGSGALIDSLLLKDDGLHGDGSSADGLWGSWYVPQKDDIIRVAIRTDDLTAGTSRTIPDAATILFTRGALIAMDAREIDLGAIGKGLSRRDTTFMVRNIGFASDSITILIDPVNVDPVTAVVGTPSSFFLAPNDSQKVKFSILPQLLVPQFYQAIVVVQPKSGLRQGSLLKSFIFQIVITGAVSAAMEVPKDFILHQNYPNPFNPSTTIRYGLPNRSHVSLTVFNTLGQQVAQLVDGDMEAGYHEIKFDALGLSSGVYFYRLRAGDFVETRKLLLVR